MKTIHWIKLLSCMITLTLSTNLLAQGAPPVTPIDGGLSLLLIGGGAYGLRKLYQKNK